MRRFARALLALSVVEGLALASCGDGDEGAPAGKAAAPDLSAAVFDEERFATFRLDMDPAAWQALVQDPENDTWRRATLDWDGELVPDVAVRPAGVTTRIPGHPKPSLRLDFNAFVPGRSWRGLGHLRLDSFVRDESFLRDRLSYRVYRDAGLAAPRAVHARLVVNGDYTGVYGVEEVLTKPFVRRHWGDDAGNLYEVLHVQSTAPDPYLWVDGQVSSYVPFPFEPDTNEDGDHADVVRFLDTLNHGRREALDVDAFLQYLGILQALADFDGLTASWGANNHSWFRPAASSRFIIIPWDPEFSLGLFGMSPQRSLWEGTTRTVATSWIAQDPDASATFLRRAREVAETALPAMLGRIDVLHAQIRDAVLADPYKHKSTDAFNASPAALKSWIQQRIDFVLR